MMLSPMLSNTQPRFGKAYVFENVTQEEGYEHFKQVSDVAKSVGSSGISGHYLNGTGAGQRDKYMVLTDEDGIPHRTVMEHLEYRTEKLPAREINGADRRNQDISRIYLGLPEVDLKGLVNTIAEAIPEIKESLADDQKALIRWNKIETPESFANLEIPPTKAALEAIFASIPEGPRATLSRKLRDWSAHMERRGNNTPLMQSMMAMINQHNWTQPDKELSPNLYLNR